MPKTIAVLDGNSLMHRAYHAVPPTMNAPDGTPTNAAFGFMSMFVKFVETMRPDAVICAFDKGKCTFRMEMLESYKAQRPPMDDELRVQFPVIQKLLEAMNVPVVMIPGWEGDDILGTIAARDEELGYATLLVTGDKDAYQLASDLTSIVTTKKGITDVVVYGPAEVEERYGVRPDQFTDFLGLKGDKVDNIPGVPGIGDKKASMMLQDFGHLEGIYENLASFKGKQLENLTNHKDDAFLSREVAVIRRDADIDIDLESASFPDFDAARVTEAFQEIRFMGHLSKVLQLSGSQAQSAEDLLSGYEDVVRGNEAKDALQAALSDGDDAPIAVALRRASEASLFGEGITVAVNVGERTALFEGDAAKEALSRIVAEVPFVAHDAKSVIAAVYPPDESQLALAGPAQVLGARFFDVALAAYVSDSNNGAASIPALMERYAGALMPESHDDDEALVLEAAAIACLREPLLAELDKHEAREVYEKIDAPLIGVLACMERVGACIDTEHLQRLAQSTAAEIDELRSRIYEAAGREFNVDSPKQLSQVLFEELGLTPKRKNQRGYSTDARVLKELSSEHELPGLVLEYREYAKIKSTYIDALPSMMAGDGRVHTSFNQMVTTTGRLSSSGPNLQNIPVRTEFGRQIRTCFVPLRDGEVFLSADYSQIELRLLAHLSGDEHLIAAFRSGEDFHANTAARVFGVPASEVTPQLRSRAKAVNFGIVYGQQAYGLSQSLQIPFGEAKDMIDRYFEAYPGVRRYLDDVVAQAHERGYAETLYGRRRYIPELKAKMPAQRGFGERTAMNHPMQGTAADIIKLAMRQVADELEARGFQAKLLLQVHDELDFSVPEGEVEELSAFVADIMQNVAQLDVPLIVDVQSGKNWAESH